MEGIKETKEAIEFVASLSTAVGKAMDDGELNLKDLMVFLPALILGPSAIAGIGLIKAEAADYTDEEIKALSAYFQAKFDIPNDKIEGYIEAGLQVALGLAKMVASRL